MRELVSERVSERVRELVSERVSECDFSRLALQVLCTFLLVCHVFVCLSFHDFVT